MRLPCLLAALVLPADPGKAASYLGWPSLSSIATCNGIKGTMGKMMRRTLWGAFLVLVIVGATFFGLRVFAALDQGYSWDEMDWDSDGTTSISEFFASSDIGKRQEVENGQSCVEYFAYKDGLAVKKVCDQGASH